MHHTATPFSARTLARRAYRARRRIALASGLSFLAGTLLYAPVTGTVATLPFPVFAGLLYAGVVALAGVLVSVFLPGIRHMVELVALSRLAVAALAFAVPAFAAKLILSPLLSATLVVGGAALARHLLERARTLPPLPARSITVNARSRHGPEALRAYAEDGSLEAALNEEFRSLPGAASLSSEGSPIRLDGLKIGIRGDRSVLTLRLERQGLPLQLWISGWLDDTLGRALDTLLPGPAPMPVRTDGTPSRSVRP